MLTNVGYGPVIFYRYLPLSVNWIPKSKTRLSASISRSSLIWKPTLSLNKNHLRSFKTMALTKVIIDTDAGIDDALAIFTALAVHKQKKLEIVAITTAQGNTKVDNVNKNVLRILKTANLLEQIPVYSGATKSLVHPWKFSGDPFHGQDGFGDAQHPSPPPPTSYLQKEHAVWALINLAKKYSGNVVLAALAPLTNVALAIRLDPSFLSHFADIYVMGGNITGEGNVTVSGEFNFTCDPEAARVVLEEAQRPIHLAPWEICLYQTNLSHSVRRDLGNLETPEAELMSAIEAKVFDSEEEWVTCDQLLMAWLLDNLIKAKDGSSSKGNAVTESLATSTKQYFATVEVQGSLTRGQMVIDRNGYLKRSPNVIQLSAVNMDVYKRYLRMGFGGEVKKN